MKHIKVDYWQCDYCGEKFDEKWKCEGHEIETHKCPKCEHSYYVYGCELSCELTDNHKLCKFKEKENDNEKNG